jgi:hypothetical protein
MATTKILIPTKSSYAVRQAWKVELSAILDAGNDVQFADADGNNMNVTFIGLFAGTDGAVKCKAENDPTATTQSFVAGGWHHNPASFFYADGTDASLGLHAKIEG